MLPNCVAAIVTVPKLAIVAVVPLIFNMLVSNDVKLTESPEVDVADNVNGASVEFFAANAGKVMVCEAFVISADNPVGCVKLYLAASVPPKTKLGVTEIPVPTLAEANVPPPLTVTLSDPTMPFKVAPEMVAVELPLKILF